MKFCEKCNSILLKDSCSNKKCSSHKIGTEYATYRQIDYIKDMLFKLGESEDQYNFHQMTIKEASKIIKELEDKLEIGGE